MVIILKVTRSSQLADDRKCLEIEPDKTLILEKEKKKKEIKISEKKNRSNPHRGHEMKETG